MMREDRLAIAVARGYRARAWHLQGDVLRAREEYSFAISALAALEEWRAQAYFLRMRAQLQGSDRRADIAAALNLANATRQMDIAYRLRIMIALDNLTRRDGQDCSEEGKVTARRMLDDATRYALRTDMHRVRVEASAALAEARHCSGDHEGALRSVSDAMMVASRFGMEARKIMLRAQMARIMAARGHPVTATKLAQTTIKIASRRRFQPAIDDAENSLLSIPRVSPVVDVIDPTLRRQL